VRVGSLFSGYGGLDLAVLDVIKGAKVAWHVENDHWPSQILKHHNPKVPNFGDITKVDFSTVPKVDILTGGYPCQPFSIQGVRKGTEDERHLFPYVRQAISTLRPKLTLLENVSGHRSLGFDTVLADLAEDGFDVRWHCLPAWEIGTPHHRDRIFILISEASNTIGGGFSDGFTIRPKQKNTTTSVSPILLPGTSQADLWGEFEGSIRRWELASGRAAPLAVEKNRNGNPRLTAAFLEWMMGLPEGHVSNPAIKVPYHLQKQIIGNGVCPQQASAALRFLLEDSNFDIIG